MVVEVTLSEPARDREAKRRAGASAGIPLYLLGVLRDKIEIPAPFSFRVGGPSQLVTRAPDRGRALPAWRLAAAMPRGSDQPAGRLRERQDLVEQRGNTA
jgi:hypothetical protein